MERVTILVTTDDAMRVLTGTTMGVVGDDGREYDLRLFTADELERSMAESQQKFGVNPPPGGNRPHAERLTRPIPLP